MITIKTPQEIEIMAEGGKILAKIMKELEKNVKPGITTEELDRLAEGLISCPPKAWAKADKIKCSFKGYKSTDGETVRPYPNCLCTSINQVVVHGVPSDYELKSGDILSLDLGIKYKGFFSDMAITLPVGKIEPEVSRLIEVTEESLKLAVKKIKPGLTFGDIGSIIQKYVESQAYSARGANGPIRGFKVIRELCGHGIGKELHEEPQILNYRGKEESPELKSGMVFCLEPMVTMGDWRIKKSPDGFGWETKDGSLTSHFEHTIVVTKTGCRILTELK